MDDCFDPTCHSKQDLFKMMLSRKKGKKERAKMMAAVETIKGQSSSSSSSSSSGALMSQEDEDRIKTQAEVDGIECPADREELGRQSWTLLHTMAAYYPKKPSSSQKTMAGQFLHSLSHLYPCKHCSHYLRESMKTNPPRLESRDSFSIWMCEQHNEVNKRLGKKEFDCEIGEIYKRWRVGDPSCWIPAGYVPEEGEDMTFLTTARESLGHDNDDE